MSLRKNFLLMFLGRGVYAAAQWLLIIIIARMVGPEALGHFSLALAITGPIIVLSQLNMRAYMATDIANTYSFNTYLTARLLLTSLALAVIAVIAWNKSDEASGIYWLILLVGLYKSIESISDLYYGVIQRREVMRPIAMSMALHGITALALMVAALTLDWGIVRGAMLIAGAWLILLVAYDWPAANRPNPERTRTTGGRAAALIVACIPLGGILAMMSLRLNMPAYFIESQLGAEELGFYSAAAYFMLAGYLVSGSLVQAAAPRLANYLKNKELTAMTRLIGRLLGLAAVLGAGGIVIALAFGDVILKLIYGDSFATYANVLAWIMAAAGFGYASQFLGLVLTVTRTFNLQLIAGGIGVIATFILCRTLIPEQGLVGAAMAVAGGSLATLLANAVAAWQQIRKFRIVGDAT